MTQIDAGRHLADHLFGRRVGDEVTGYIPCGSFAAIGSRFEIIAITGNPHPFLAMNHAIEADPLSHSHSPLQMRIGWR
jgi:hypothetical protein